MAKMLGNMSKSFCPYCRTTAGPDCPDSSKSPKMIRKIEKRQWKKEVDRDF